MMERFTKWTEYVAKASLPSIWLMSPIRLSSICRDIKNNGDAQETIYHKDAEA